MDPFEVRMQFVNFITRISSSLGYTTKMAYFALHYGPQCADDLWDCLCEETEAANINMKVNILYFVDALVDPIQYGLMAYTAPGRNPYPLLITRDLEKLVDLVMPNTLDGVLNYLSTVQILRSWGTRRLINTSRVEEVLRYLQAKKTASDIAAKSNQSATLANMSHNDILQRFEDDRERHKRLKQKQWLLPIPTSLFPQDQLSTHPDKDRDSVQALSGSGPDLPIEVEFDHEWDRTSTMNGLSEQDRELMRVERLQCFNSDAPV